MRCLIDGQNRMWKQIFVMVALLSLGVNIGRVEQIAAQNTSEQVIKQPGMVMTRLKYVSKQNEPTAGDALLCVINTQNEGPQWFLLNADAAGQNERLGAIAAKLGFITEIKASADGKYLALVSTGEGRWLLEVVDLPKLFQQKSYTVLYAIDPDPGVITIRSWDGPELQISSDVLLTRRDPKTGRVPPELVLVAPEIFALNVMTGELTGVSDGAKNPVAHYSKVLMDQQASQADKDKALATLLTLKPDEVTMTYLLKALEQEKDPKRILKLLDHINNLRGK
jgi:hypothetical protein